MGSEDHERATAAFDDSKLEQLQGEVKLVSRSFVQVALPEPWAATSVPVKDLPLQRGDAIELAGIPDVRFDVIAPASDTGEAQTRKGFRAMAVRYEHDGAQHAALVKWPPEASEDPPAEPKTDEETSDEGEELDWSDL